MRPMDPWEPRLSEYLDGELAPDERAALERHLERCADCRAELDELREIVEAAGALADRPPAAELWPGIAARLRPRGHSRWRDWSARAVTFSVPQLVAAVLACIVLAAGALRLMQPAAPGGVAEAPAAEDGAVRFAAQRGDAAYDAAVADLERVLAEGRDRLDPATVRVLEESLATIDRAIEEARRAVAEDTASAYLNTYLAESRRRKLELLRQAATLVRAQT